MTNDIRGTAVAQRVARGGTARILRFPANPRMAKGAPALDADARRDPVPLSAKDAASQILASGILERIADDMARLNKEIAAKPLDPAKQEFIAALRALRHALGWK